MGFKQLLAYQRAFELAMEIFKLSKGFPSSEQFALTSQIIRSSRSICANIAEAYRKRQYEKHFISKLSDADSENAETQLWLDFALECNYLSQNEKEKLESLSHEIGKLINYMMNHPEKFR